MLGRNLKYINQNVKDITKQKVNTITMFTETNFGSPPTEGNSQFTHKSRGGNLFFKCYLHHLNTFIRSFISYETTSSFKEVLT